jgi:MEDS: MEthanogen/methylotroph, DcmR Sensory domain/Histidine kinase-like ATPase domain
VSGAEDGHEPRRLTHVGMFYQDQTDLLKSSQRYVQEGLEANEPVLIAQPPAQLNRLREVLPVSREVTYVDMSVAGHNPGRILPWILHDFILRHPDRRVRIVSEPVWPNRAKAAYPACVQHEGLLNMALESLDAQVLCPYDIAHLPPRAIDDSHVTHPFVQYGTGPVRPNDEYTPLALAAAIDQPLEPPPPSASHLMFGWTDLRMVRARVAEWAITAGMAPGRIAPTKLAVGEAAANAVRHGGGRGLLRMWQEADHLVFDVHSALPLGDPVAGRLQPRPDRLSGRGIALINHLCDLVRLDSSQPWGTTIRMWIPCPA